MNSTLSSPSVWAVIPAAGLGTRMGTDLHKQFLPLPDGRPILSHSLRLFEDAPEISGIILVISPEDRNRTEDLIRQDGCQKVRSIVHGGMTRQLSVRNGLAALPSDCEYVLIHDAARPYLRRDDLLHVLSDAFRYDASTLAVPVKDTIKVVDENGFAIETPDRTRLMSIQTPQVFRRNLIASAHDRAYVVGDITNSDDCLVVERYTDTPVHLCVGSYSNIKITTPDDLPGADAANRVGGAR